jgi:hypothetical protein
MAVLDPASLVLLPPAQHLPSVVATRHTVLQDATYFASQANRVLLGQVAWVNHCAAGCWESTQQQIEPRLLEVSLQTLRFVVGVEMIVNCIRVA